MMRLTDNNRIAMEYAIRIEGILLLATLLLTGRASYVSANMEMVV